MKESKTLEFKRELTDGIIKETIAFLNTDGGTIIIGYDDYGKLIGLKNAKEDLDRLSNKLFEAIEPDISFLINPRIENENGKEIIILEILKGTSKPYYIKSKGMTEKGTFVRIGTTSMPATNHTIREMIIMSAGRAFETCTSINQDLTFFYTEKIFKDKHLAFTNKEKKMLKIINENNKYTNLGLLLSDQCPYTIKLAIYKDNTKTEFLDRKETRQGSIIEQLEEADRYLYLNNKVRSKIEGLYREDEYDYPNPCLRELLLNAICHRNYEVSGSILIHIYQDKIEFLSPGGLVDGMTIEDIKLGNSSSRNPYLTNILHRLELVESYGSGIPRLFETYKCSLIIPEIKTASNTFLVTIPKIELKSEYKEITHYLKNVKGGYASRDEIEKILGTKKVTTISILNEMLEKGIISKIGGSKNIKYRLK